MQELQEKLNKNLRSFLDELEELCAKYSVDMFLVGGDSGILQKQDSSETWLENVEIINGNLTVGRIFNSKF